MHYKNVVDTFVDTEVWISVCANMTTSPSRNTLEHRVIFKATFQVVVNTTLHHFSAPHTQFIPDRATQC